MFGVPVGQLLMLPLASLKRECNVRAASPAHRGGGSSCFGG